MCFICDGIRLSRWNKEEAKTHFDRMSQGQDETSIDIMHYQEMLTKLNKKCVVCFFAPCKCSSEERIRG